MVYFEDYPPLSWKDENGEMRGFLVDVMDEVLHKRMGLPLEHQGYPWARAQELVKEGQADAFCSIPTPDRSQFTTAGKEPVYIGETAFFANADSPRIQELRDFAQNFSAGSDLPEGLEFSISAVAGDGWVEENIKNMNITWVNIPRQGLEMVSTNREDLYVYDALATQYVIKQMGLSNVEQLSPALDTSIFHLCIGNQSQFIDVLPEFDQELKKLKEEGRYQVILDQYH